MDQVKIGKFLAQLRHENNLTQEMLGQRIGVTNKTISRWENGNYMPDVEMVQFLSKEFNVSISELLCGEKFKDDSIQQEEDNNSVIALKNSSFSRIERFSYWKRKWIKEHMVLIFISLIIASTIPIGAWWRSFYWAIGIFPIGWLIMYIILRNRMMKYIEKK